MLLWLLLWLLQQLQERPEELQLLLCGAQLGDGRWAGLDLMGRGQGRLSRSLR